MNLYRDVTFGGQRLERAPPGKGFRAHGEDPGWRGRTGVRNEAFFNLTFGSGLRVKEVGTLLTVEAPTEPGQRVPVEKTAKYEKLRRWQVNQAGMSAVSAYIAQDRAWAVKRAQKAGRYDAIQDPLWVTKVETTTYDGTRLYLSDGRKWLAKNIDVDERERLLITDVDGRTEPLWLWLSEGGMPLDYEGWDSIFGKANVRMQTLMRGLGKADDFLVLKPHSLRFSYGMALILALHRVWDRMHPPANLAGYDEDRYDWAYTVVQDMLGHSSIETTKDTYLEPIRHDHLWRSSGAIGDADVADILEDMAGHHPLVANLARGFDPGSAQDQ